MLTLKVRTAELFRTEYDVILPNGEVKIIRDKKPTEKDFLLLMAKNGIDFQDDKEKTVRVNERSITTGYGNFIAAEIQKLDAAKIDYVIEWEEEKEKADYRQHMKAATESAIKGLNVDSMLRTIRNSGVVND